VTTVRTPETDPLAPVRAALLADARADAEHSIRSAEREAADVVARADREASALRDEARRQGEDDARAVLVTAHARARRHARAVEMAAQREAYDELRRRVVEAAPLLRDDPGYPVWRAGLEQRARLATGPGATVTEPEVGGVVAVSASGGRRFGCTLVDAAEEALRATDVSGLWSP
jgi:vacuolar-type H+-ATPase subunit E/Vma4